MKYLPTATASATGTGTASAANPHGGAAEEARHPLLREHDARRCDRSAVVHADLPCGDGIPHGMVSHTAWYPARHGIPHGTLSHKSCCDLC
jgi:hypothetical protein